MNCKHVKPPVDRTLSRPLSCLIVTLAMLAFGIADASARGGGGGRMAQSSVSGANRSMSRPTGSANTANRANTGNVNTGNVNRGNVNTGNVNTGNVNRGNVNTGNVNTGNINTGNVNRANVNTGNVNIGNDVNVNIEGGYGYRGPGYGGGYYHPVAAGAVIGAMAVTTAAVVGSYYRTLPPSCTTVVKNGVSYSHCGSVYYQQTWSGNDVVYVVASP